ncbi:MAG TPA: VWA domain-containing protein [Thermoanaerobaculia bacterium]|nr:VWA domain-containing protein [Thermoanaerobaculia bacterium]
MFLGLMHNGVAAFFLLIELAAATVRGGVQIVVPPAGSQVIGKGYVEVSADAADVDRVEVYIDDVLAGVARHAPWRVPADFGESISPHRIEARLYSNHYATRESTFMTTAGMSASQMVNVDLVEVPLRIRGNGRRLSPGDLLIRENGAPQKILELKPSRSPARFTFVIDHSLSMGRGKLTAAIAAARRALDSLRPGDTAGLILFNHRVEPSQRFTPSLQTIEIIPSGGTSLRDAVAAAPLNERGVIIVISDGGDRNSLLSEERALRIVSRSNVTLYALTLGRGTGSHFLETAAARSGGACLASDRDHLTRDLQRLMNDINSSYVAEYQSAGTKSGWRSVEVEAREKGIAVLSSRKGYYAE